MPFLRLFARMISQGTQLSLTNRATHLRKCNGVSELLKHAPTCVCYHAAFGRSALKCIGINTGEPQRLRSVKLRSLSMGDVADPKITPLPRMCYHVKFGSSASKVVCIYSRDLQKLACVWAPPPCGRGVTDHLEIRRSPHVLS